MSRKNLKLAERLAAAVAGDFISMEEADGVWLRETGLECYWPEWA